MQVTPRIFAALACSLAAPFAFGQATEPTIFVLANVSDTVSSYQVLSDGTLDFVDAEAASDGPISAALSPDGKWLAVGHGTINNVEEVLLIFAVQENGSLQLRLGATVPDSPLGMTWISDTHVAILETGASFVRIYEFDPFGPSLTEIDNAFSGSFSTSVVTNADRTLLFVQDSTTSTIRSWTINADGTIDQAGFISTSPAFPLDLAVTNASSRIYAAGGISNGGDKISGFSFDNAGDFTPLPGTPFTSPGASPSQLAVTDDDAFLIAGHGTDATMRTFTINADGSLTSTGFSFDVGSQGTLGGLATIGRMLFVTDESTVSDGVSGVYAFTVENDGSLTQNGPILSTGDVRPETIVAWPGLTLGDLNGDGAVNGADLAELLSQWGGPGAADLNGDGVVDGSDLAMLLANWTG